MITAVIQLTAETGRYVVNCSADVSDHAVVLRRVPNVSEKLEAQTVARYMFQCNALTAKELQSIQSEHKKPVNAANELLSIVVIQSSNVFSCFLDALKKTDQQYLYEVIVTGSCEGTKDLSVVYVTFIDLFL